MIRFRIAARAKKMTLEKYWEKLLHARRLPFSVNEYRTRKWYARNVYLSASPHRFWLKREKRNSWRALCWVLVDNVCRLAIS